MKQLLRTLLPLAAIALAVVTPSARAETAISQAREFAPRQLLVKLEGQRTGRALELAPGAGVLRSARALRRNPRVVYAEPNYFASASAPGEPFEPNDSGSLAAAAGSSSVAGNWAFRQWNFLPPEGRESGQLPVSPGGIDAVGAWGNLIDAGRPGAAGIVVAVLDSGIAYRSFDDRFLRSPDFAPEQFVPGHDFIGHDRFPLDKSGHGTHVAGTIAERTDNGLGVTGVAYGAKLMPIRVLNRNGVGNALAIAKGIRFAIAHEAQVINMSFNFACRERVPIVNEALRAAYEKGIVVVASAGNRGSEGCVSPPATGPHVIAVGGTTEGACLGRYSLTGAAIDLVAPGGGKPRRGCPSVAARPIYQVTLKKDSIDEFAIPPKYVGTSMAAAHVSGVAALVLASAAIDPALEPEARVDAVIQRLRRTARDLGYRPNQQGAGLLDAARATAPPS
jgi:serine protease